MRIQRIQRDTRFNLHFHLIGCFRAGLLSSKRGNEIDKVRFIRELITT